MDSIQQAQVQFEQTFTKYAPFLTEIRKRLLFTLSIFLITLTIGFIYSDAIIRTLFKMFHIHGVNIVFTSPFQFINLSVSVAFLVGVVIVFPLLLFQIISFLKPALSSHEYKAVLCLLPISILLFLIGAGFGLIVMRYVVMTFYEQSIKLNIGNFLDISHLLSQILTIAILLGLAFQFPILLTVLLRLKFIKHRSLVKKRLWVYALSAMFAALLPPADLPSTIFYFLPLVLLFEFTMLLNKWILKTHLL